jgi:soluble lytic murein transglycosylase
VKKEIIYLSIMLSASCATQSDKSSLALPTYDANTLFLEKIIQNPSKEMKTHTYSKRTQDDIKRLKEYFSDSKSRHVARAQSSKSTVVQDLKNKSYDRLAAQDVTILIRAMSSLSQDQFDSLAVDLKLDVTCKAPTLSFALANVLEKRFPEQQAYDSSLFLYDSVLKCSKQDELSARTNYRLAMLSLLKNDCSKALSYFGSVKSTDLKFAVSRASFWKAKCGQSSDKNKLSLASTYYNSYPLSYHAILQLQNSELDANKLVTSRLQTPVQTRTAKNNKINQLLELVEKNIHDNPKTSKEYLSWLNDGMLNSIEPEVLIYIGYLSNQIKDDLTSFRVLSKAFTAKPELKTKATVELYFPLRYVDEIKKTAQMSDLDYHLVLALIRQESAFNDKAMSRVGARGLMQLMPRTAKLLDRNLNKSNLFNVEKNVSAGTKYLAQLMKRYDNNVVYALAAYNAGFGNVDKWIVRYQTKDPLVFMDVIPFQETREYVSSILRNYYWYKSLTPADVEAEKTIIGFNYKK